MLKIYKVLWIDDEFEQLTALVTHGIRHNIHLTGFTSVEAGFESLRQNLSQYDAILLDAKSFERKNQVRGTEHERALDQARDEIMSLKHEKVFPFFVFTGQKGLQNDESFRHRYEGKYFKKGSQDETERLFAAIKAAVDEQPETQLRDRYAPAFAACTNQVVGEHAGRLLVKVLQAIEKPQANHDDDTHFNTLRKLVEAFLYATHRHQVLPIQCLTDSKVNFTYSQIFFSGKAVRRHDGSDGVQAKRPIMPAVLSDSLRNLVELTNNGSHFLEDPQITTLQRLEAKEKLFQLRQKVKTPYLLASLTYQLLDLLAWFKALLDDPALASYQGEGAWTIIGNTENLIATISGTIKSIIPGGAAIFRSDADNIEAYIKKQLADKQMIVEGQQVQVILDSRPPSPGKLSTVVRLIV
jgi:hypothetical protein